MLALDLAQTAGILCLSAKTILEDCPRLSDEALSEYWAASRCRLDCWGRRLRIARHAGDDSHDELRQLAEEIYVSQILTRSVAALCVLHDAHHDQEEAGPIGRNVLAGHNEAITRLTPLVDADPLERGYLRNEMGVKARRWTDFLLGYLLPICGPPDETGLHGQVLEFAFDAERVIEFAYDAKLHARRHVAEADSLLTAALGDALAPCSKNSPNADLNYRLASASLGLLGPEAFDSYGLLRSTWLSRLERSADDALMKVEQIFSDDALRPPQGPSGPRW